MQSLVHKYIVTHLSDNNMITRNYVKFPHYVNYLYQVKIIIWDNKINAEKYIL